MAFTFKSSLRNRKLYSADSVAGDMKVRLGKNHNSRRDGALPLTPQTKELSSVEDHRYGRRRKGGGG